MRIGLLAIAGLKLQTRKFAELGVTLPQFMNRGRIVAQLPSLALLTIAGSAPSSVDLEYVEIDDVASFTKSPRLDFDLVALSTYTARAPETYRLADAYRDLGVPVVLGGLHASLLPEEAAAHADAVVAGEGETLWPEVVEDFLRSGRAGLRPVYRETRPGSYDLADSPPPRFDLLLSDGASRITPWPDERGTGEIHPFGPYNRLTVQTSRGCPLDCDFCAASKLYSPRYRIKPVERVLAEIDAIRSSWRRPFIEFADDNTFVNKAWAKRLLRELAGRGVRYFTETDVSVADDEELLDLLYPSGCRQLLIGFESPTREGLEGIDRANWKARRHADYCDAIEKIQCRGVSVCGCFIVGLDSDTPEIFGTLAEFIERSRLLEVQITILTPFPGTRLYQRFLSEGRLLSPNAWERCTLFDVNFRPLRMSVEQLEEGVAGLWRETWSEDALTRRKRHYRDLLRSRRGGGEYPESEPGDLVAFPARAGARS